MTFSEEWEQLFKANSHVSIWPWSDLVSYVSRHAKPADDYVRVLELGCGVGANIPFFLKRGSDYHAIEGSASAAELVRKTYPMLAANIACGDFTCSLPPGPFDLVVDRAATAHNTTAAVRRTLHMVHERLRPGGKLIGIDWFSTEHEGASRGIAVDSHTRRDIESGSLSGLGEVHFFDHDHLVALLTETGFSVEFLEHKRNELFDPSGERRRAWWNFVARKP
jgi:SAM-dependent methyltransferase